MKLYLLEVNFSQRLNNQITSVFILSMYESGMEIKKRTWDILRFLIGISIISLLILKLGAAEVVDVISSMNLYIVLLVIISLLLTIFLYAAIIKILTEGLGEEIGITDSLRYYLPSHALGLLTPGRVGRLSLLYFLKKNKISYGVTLAVLVLERLVAYITLSAIAIYGFFIFFERDTALKVTFYLLLFLLILGLLIKSEKIRKIIQDFVLGKYAEKFEGFYRNLEFLVKVKKTILALTFFLSFARLALAAFVKYLMFLYFNVNVSFFDVLVISSISGLTALIPISISGLGVRESSAVYLFYKIGVDPAISGGIFLFVTIMRYVTASIILGIYSKEIKNIKILLWLS